MAEVAAAFAKGVQGGESPLMHRSTSSSNGSDGTTVADAFMGGHTSAYGGHGGAHSSAAVQASVNRLAGLHMNNQAGFTNLAVAGAPGHHGGLQQQAPGPRMAHGSDMSAMLGEGSLPQHLQGSFALQHKGNLQGVQGAGMGLQLGVHHQEAEYETLLSELQWAQGVPLGMHGAQQGLVSPPLDPSAHLPSSLNGGSHASAHPAGYDLAGFKRDGMPMPPGSRLSYGTAVNPAMSKMHSLAVASHAGCKRSRGMLGVHGEIDQRMLMANGMHVPQGVAHKDALMELARENLMLKHQLQVASIELSRLRHMCEKFQQDTSESANDSKTNMSRYWTDDEHQRFLEAIQKYGHKDVKAIAGHVGSRNATQVRTHAQKYFMRLARSSKQGGDSIKCSGSNGGGSASELGDDVHIGSLRSLRVETAAAAAAASGEAGTSAAAAAAFLHCKQHHSVGMGGGQQMAAHNGGDGSHSPLSMNDVPSGPSASVSVCGVRVS